VFAGYRASICLVIVVFPGFWWILSSSFFLDRKWLNVRVNKCNKDEVDKEFDGLVFVSQKLFLNNRISSVFRSGINWKIGY
jgi:hypothetical protein